MGSMPTGGVVTLWRSAGCAEGKGIADTSFALALLAHVLLWDWSPAVHLAQLLTAPSSLSETSKDSSGAKPASKRPMSSPEM